LLDHSTVKHQLNGLSRELAKLDALHLMVMSAVLGRIRRTRGAGIDRKRGNVQVIIGGNVDGKLLTGAASARENVIPIAQSRANGVRWNGDVLIRDLSGRASRRPIDIAHDQVG